MLHVHKHAGGYRKYLFLVQSQKKAKRSVSWNVTMITEEQTARDLD